jgi:hypothetical protein
MLARFLVFALFIANIYLVLGNNECNIFSVNGSAISYFDYYRFYDFRNVANATKPSPRSLDGNSPKTLSVKDNS